mgnify:FL=1|jgi:hypothetical protein
MEKIKIVTDSYGVPLEIQIDGKKITGVGSIDVIYSYDCNRSRIVQKLEISLADFESLEIVEQEREVK